MTAVNQFGSVTTVSFFFESRSCHVVHFALPVHTRTSRRGQSTNGTVVTTRWRALLDLVQIARRMNQKILRHIALGLHTEVVTVVGQFSCLIPRLIESEIELRKFLYCRFLLFATWLLSRVVFKPTSYYAITHDLQYRGLAIFLSW